VFDKTKSILESTESSLLGFSTKKNYLDPVQRLFIYPFMFLKMGFGDFTRPMAIWSSISFVLILVLTLLVSKTELPPNAYVILLNICVWGLLLLISFSTPSSYAFYGATGASVKNTVIILSDNNVNSVVDVDLLESNIEKVEDRIDERVKFYKWLIASVWGSYILLINFQLRFISLSGTKPDEAFLKSTVESLGYLMLFSVVALLFMVCYKRASKMLVANIRYACVQQKSSSQKS
jgi:hypothetical protein